LRAGKDVSYLEGTRLRKLPKIPGPGLYSVRLWGRENKGLKIFAAQSRANREFIVNNLRQSYKEFGIYDEVAEVFEREAQIFVEGSQ
jgi:hypothetical protein